MGLDVMVRAGLPVALLLLLLSAGIEDVRVREIANWKNGLIAALAPFWWWAHGFGAGDVGAQVALAAAAFALFAAAFRWGAMGGGDVKMIAALALWFPLQPFAELLLAMSLAGGAVTAALLVERRWRGGEVEVPYGVAIAIAGLLALDQPLLNQIS